MISDMENGEIGIIVTKDLSRLGRNQLHTGLYIEERFPMFGVRYIAINDNVDTDSSESNDLMPFKNLFNEWFIRDTSRKIRAVLKAKAERGERLGTRTPYGYRKDPGTKKLIVDDEAAAIVRRRLAALGKLQAIAGEIYSSITKGSEMLQVRYEQKANNSTLLYPQSAEEAAEDFYREQLSERQRLDILRGNTGIGPHRDDLQLLLNGLSLRAFGSQGQQRSGALALKLSQLQYVKNELGEFPVLLLDDVMSELDNSRRAQLLLFIDGRVQTFITVNDRELIPELAGNAYFKISGGSISEA